MEDGTVRYRFGGSKTRTGCVTCKARRVKCDERKPMCLRCEKAGRACDGYRSPSPRARPAELKIISYIPTPHRTLSAQPETALRERRALDYFQHKTAIEISGACSGELWSRFMLLIAAHQSSVKHALVALGSVHEDYVNAESATQQPASDYALQHYSKAIGEVLSIRDSKSENSIEIALVSCILFACLESLRGFYQSAMAHLNSGMKVLAEMEASNAGDHHAYIPRILLRSLFVRLDSQILNIGGAPNAAGLSLSQAFPLSPPRCYESLDAAVTDFEILYNRIAQFTCTAYQVGDDPDRVDAFSKKLAELDVLRIRWHQAFTNFMINNANAIDPRDPAPLTLNMGNNIALIMVNVDLRDPETDFDMFNDVFRSIVEDAEEIIIKTSVLTPASTPPRVPSPAFYTYSTGNSPTPDLPDRSTSSTPLHIRDTIIDNPTLTPRPPPRVTPTFKLDIGVVAALYFCAARCRVAPIRHKALKLMKICNRREGFWDSGIAANIAERLINIEEATLAAAGYSELYDTEVYHNIQGGEAGPGYRAIPSHMRIKTVDLQFGPETSGKAAYSYDRYDDAYVPNEEGSGPSWSELMRWE